MIPDIGISNGVMSVILNYAKAMPDDIKFDVVYFSEKEQTRQADIEALGGRVYKIASPSPTDLLTGKMKGFFAQHKDEWQALHIHCPHFAVFIAPYAKKAGIKRIAMHCHSTWYSLTPANNSRNKLLYKLGEHTVDKKFACGREAGRFWYGNDKNFTVLPNAIDAGQFRYNNSLRQAKRVEMGVQDKLVVGHLGRVSPPQKNHPFLLRIFASIKKKQENSVLLLAGAQPDEELTLLAQELGIADSVEFLGNRTDVPELLQAYDVFVFPSFREGLPVSVIEAQASGLPVVMSDSISDEACVSDRIVRLSLEDTADKWAQVALDMCSSKRTDTIDMIRENGWDIFSCAEKLADYYRS